MGRRQVSVIANNKGQFLIETILLMVFTVSLMVAATGALRDRKVMAKMIGGPWEKVAGMIESGVWKTADQARTYHPNQLKRNLSYDPQN